MQPDESAESFEPSADLASLDLLPMDLLAVLNSHTPDWIQIVDRSGRVTYQNDSLKRHCDALKLDRHVDIHEFMHPTSRVWANRARDRVFETGERSELRCLCLHIDGLFRHMLVRVTPVPDANGEVERVLSSVVDVHDHVRAMQGRNQQSDGPEPSDSSVRRQLDAILSSGIVGVLELDPDGFIRDANMAVCTMLGYSREQLRTMHRADLAFEEDRESLFAWYQKAQFDTSRNRSAVRRLRRQDTSECWVFGSSVRLGVDEEQAGGFVVSMVDITAQRMAEIALTESESRYRLIADNATDFIQMWDAAGQVLYDSPTVVSLYGDSYTKDRVYGQAGCSLLHPDDRERGKRDFLRLLKDGNPYREEYRWLLPSGEQIWIECRGRTIYASDGTPTGLVAVSRDITNRKRLETERELALEKANTANKAKTQFLANVSHELRTPLNAILGYGYLLNQTTLDSAQLEYLSHITERSNYLLSLISKVLDLSRIDAGDAGFKPDVFSLRALAERTLGAIRPAAAARGLTLANDIAAELPDLLIGDVQMTEQVLLNYLSNAVKFTEQGGVTLRIAIPMGEPNVVRMEVIDTGCGIPPEQFKNLFKAFSQLKQDKRGTGLGLEITRQLVLMMGGEVGAESELGRGSCFWFTVPLQLPSQTQVQGQAALGNASDKKGGEALEQLRARHSGASILVVEDGKLNQMLMKALLEKAGLIVHLVSDGQQALTLAQASQYAIVLMDLQMPGMDGVAATRAIRQLPGWEAVPIVALTANAFDQTREECLRAGMTDFLSKPINPQNLYSVLVKILDARSVNP